MAQNRLSRERRLASLIIATLVLVSCERTQGDSYGWSVPDGSGPFELPAGAEALAVVVELPPGYEAAEEFVQRAVLVAGEERYAVERSGLDGPIIVAVPSGIGVGSEMDLELLIGFCESTVKDVCYIDTPALTVRVVDEVGPSEPYAVTYRPEPR